MSVAGAVPEDKGHSKLFLSGEDRVDAVYTEFKLPLHHGHVEQLLEPRVGSFVAQETYALPAQLGSVLDDVVLNEPSDRIRKAALVRSSAHISHAQQLQLIATTDRSPRSSADKKVVRT